MRHYQKRGGILNSGGIQAGEVRGGSQSYLLKKQARSSGGSSGSESCQEF